MAGSISKRALVVMVNAVSSVFGGGITVARCLTDAMARARPEYHFVLCCADPQVAEARYASNVELVYRPELRSRLHRWGWEQVVLPFETSRRGADVLLGLGGYSVFASRVPQVAVWQNHNVFLPPGIALPLRERVYVFAQRLVQSLSMAKADRNVFLTQNSVEQARRYWDMDAIPHVAIHSGVSADRIVVGEPPDLSSRPPLALSVGHAYFHKNYEGLIDAFARYRERYDDPLRLEILGGAYDPEYFEGLRQRIGDRGLEGRVLMAGAATPEQVAGKLAEARVYISASRLETFGLTMFEAMGAGVPVVASRATCHPEVCGDAALYCDPDDPDDIAESLHRVVSSPDLQLELQRKGLERISHFSWERAASSYLETLEGVVNARMAAEG